MRSNHPRHVEIHLAVPADAVARREALEALLSHELTHWRRHDLWVKRMAVAVSVLHWFNPAAWWLLERLDRACDCLLYTSPSPRD